MILNLNSSSFTLDTGFYYSIPILLEVNDTLMTIEVQLNSSGSVSIQQSINGINWYDVSNTDFSCTPFGIQSYIECQPGIQFRLKSSVNFISAAILL